MSSIILVTALAQTLGEGYAIHKQDVFVRKQFQDESNDNHEFCQSLTSSISMDVPIPTARLI